VQVKETRTSHGSPTRSPATSARTCRCAARMSGNAFRWPGECARRPDALHDRADGERLPAEQRWKVRTTSVPSGRQQRPLASAPDAILQTTIQTPLVQGNLHLTRRSTADSTSGKCAGFVNIQTATGQVTLARSSAIAPFASGGGPLDLGDVFGNINAHTEAGE